MKGSIDSGSRKTITVTFAPTENTFAQIPVPGIDVWVETVKKFTLKDQSKTSICTLLLRGQVKM